MSDRPFRITIVSIALVIVLAVALLVVSTVRQSNKPLAQAQLKDAEGRDVGNARFTEDPGGVLIAVQVQGIEPGEHGVHIHEKGDCSSQDFMSAGAHFNPGNAKHGLENPEGPHAGDLPNLRVNEGGTATYEATPGRVSFSKDEASLFDSDGSALVIHAKADDQMSDPAGNSGSRVACGVIERVR